MRPTYSAHKVIMSEGSLGERRSLFQQSKSEASSDLGVIGSASVKKNNNIIIPTIKYTYSSIK